MYNFVLGHVRSYPGPRAACGLRAAHPERAISRPLALCPNSEFWWGADGPSLGCSPLVQEIMGSSCGGLSLQSSGAWSEKLTGLGGTASTVKGVCGKSMACLRHVGLNIHLLHPSLTAVESKGSPMFPGKLRLSGGYAMMLLSQGYYFPHFINLSLAFLSYSQFNMTIIILSYQALNLRVLGKIGCVFVSTVMSSA